MTKRLACMILGAVFFLIMSLSLAFAQENAEPLVEVELAETEAIPGQPVVLRMSVLVPTWLPKPVSFPTFEVPDVMVKLPERATSPISKSIEGETWSGVSRSYRLSPMVAGPITIPEQELTIFWADPGKTDPIVTKARVAAMNLTGIVPDGAEDLDPFIAATGLTLSQNLSSESRMLKPGDSLTREVVLEVEGTSPLFLPSLLPPHEITGIASYPSEPEVTETIDRSWVSGTRKESTIFVAESGGSGTVPALELAWYNLETKRVETARIDGFELTVDGPVARDRPDVDPRLLAVIAIVGAALLFGCVRLSRWLLWQIRNWRADRKRAREASEEWAFAQVKIALQRRDYGAVMRALTVWKARLPQSGDLEEADLRAALLAIGRNLYGHDTASSAAAWRDLTKTIATHRSQRVLRKKDHAGGAILAPINPR
ncbi:MAG: hypothetical protein AAFO72_01345 [Pseudomonadota bacterium]